MAKEIEGILYLELEDALRLHAIAVEGSVVQSRHLLRAPSQLEGALDRPINWALYQGADIALQAAALTHGIAESQPFLDGNKRLAAVAMGAFLTSNGYLLDVTDDQVFDWIMGLSRGLSVEELAERIRSCLTA